MAYCSSDLVIIGIASEVVPVRESVVEVEISPVWGFKGLRDGRNANTSYVFTANTDRASCGMPFEQGELYLILAQALNSPGEIEPGWFTKPLDKAADVRAYLDALPKDRNVCETGDSEETPRYLLPTIWRKELLRELQNETGVLPGKS